MHRAKIAKEQAYGDEFAAAASAGTARMHATAGADVAPRPR